MSRTAPPTTSTPARSGEWRCVRCGLLLAVLRGERLHIRFSGGHEYLVGFPATSTCKKCGSLNEVREATSLSTSHSGTCG